MKKIILSTLILVFGTIYAQKTKPQSNKIDKKLVGLWKGSEKDQQIDGMEKLWVMDRKEDGTFTLIFTTVQNCEINQHIEKGQWWVENGEFHELHFNSGNTDVYTYEVPDKSHIKFKSKNMSMDMINNEYSFVDTKIEDEN
ncbi:hypothetical protein [Chryseobacterium indoltheticum]|uniref:Lipocalin-like domain-containing protein n=1 Tax=Chryseobacterium indoltheticum TaxID=254 RepID=A0A381F7Y3_9FLAO|nr:hypothetical protein [Chryseobacterium indoltheticum]AZA72998.1 hypothetical protein EG358_04120 [Chryseobacterium indoltheticum]QQQ26588.1 hypothetical protein JJL46_10655 [Chryseobacterium indoltheticum]SIP91087.1 hypothetical protein SAMN05421682_101300 [Chryseobacterium indoltheticum]SUX42607.1 Uncharacterised protein [Chryseobacterium indoltheticum]